MILIICEKPSAKNNFSKALGGAKGKYNGEEYKLTNTYGHILSFPNSPEMMVADTLKEKYKSWSNANLPWKFSDFSFTKIATKNLQGKSNEPIVKSLIEEIKKADEIVIASDLDPSGEGFLLVAEILEKVPKKDLNNKIISRMYFLDEEEKSLQKAFVERKRIKDIHKNSEYIKAYYRQRWDYMSMQWTRMFSNAYKEVTGQIGILRNGRLKSAMVNLIGNQYMAYMDYEKVASYERAYVDENGNYFLNKDNEKYKNKNDVSLENLKESSIEIEKTEAKKKAPPKLLDLSALSSILAKKGYKADMVLKTYQKMYEDKIVSYPRTEDKVISEEQFISLEKIIDELAEANVFDVELLTHREMRKTHVKNGGSHGANRIIKVLLYDELRERYGNLGEDIYRELVKSCLAMFCEDYTYESVTACISDDKDYKATIQVPKNTGWKIVYYGDTSEFNDEDTQEIQKQQNKTFGSISKPCIKESFAKRPEYPNMKWLMKQLDKLNIGTGATRTSTYAEITNIKAKYPQMTDKKGKIDLTTLGKCNYVLLENTYIGNSSSTKELFDEMDKIAKEDMGENEISNKLNNIENLIVSDMKIIEENTKKLKEMI